MIEDLRFPILHEKLFKNYHLKWIIVKFYLIHNLSYWASIPCISGLNSATAKIMKDFGPSEVRATSGAT
jgi:hypothetical protein